MQRPALILPVLLALAGTLVLVRPGAAEDDLRIRLIAHRSRAGEISEAEARAIYLKQKVFWDDGKTLVPINHEAGSRVREEFSRKLFGQNSRRLANYWNQRYFEAGEFPPATLASDEAVIRFVSENPEAVGYVTQGELAPEVVVVLDLE